MRKVLSVTTSLAVAIAGLALLDSSPSGADVTDAAHRAKEPTASPSSAAPTAPASPVAISPWGPMERPTR